MTNAKGRNQAEKECYPGKKIPVWWRTHEKFKKKCTDIVRTSQFTRKFNFQEYESLFLMHSASHPMNNHARDINSTLASHAKISTLDFSKKKTTKTHDNIPLKIRSYTAKASGRPRTTNCSKHTYTHRQPHYATMGRRGWNISPRRSRNKRYKVRGAARSILLIQCNARARAHRIPAGGSIREPTHTRYTYCSEVYSRPNYTERGGKNDIPAAK